MSIEAPTDFHEVIEVQNLALEPTMPAQPLLLRIVLRTSRVRYDMHLLPVDPCATGQTVMELLRELYSQNRGRRARYLGPLLRVLTMQKIAISSAPVVPRQIDHEQQSYPMAVSIEAAEQNMLLTIAFRRPFLHQNHRLFAQRHLSFAAEVTVNVERRNALLIGSVFSTYLACTWLGIAIVISAIAGISAGVLNDSLFKGLGFGSGVLAMLTAIQGLLLWLAR